MHGEAAIRRGIKPLLDRYGELNTSEIKALIGEVLTLSADDLEQSASRNEPKITQRIGNIVSHQKETIHEYEEGFIVDKSKDPALFYPVTGLSGKTVPLPEDERKKRKRKANKEKNSRKARKIDWEALNEEHSNTGKMGEEFVFEREKKIVAGFDPKAVSRVIHVSKESGDGEGYDISSINELGDTVYIEVKTTTGPADTAFYLSRNEKAFLREPHKDNTRLVYRVYNFDKNTKRGEVLELPAEKLFANYEMEPTMYRVKKK